jgi:hypothetical protein
VLQLRALASGGKRSGCPFGIAPGTLRALRQTVSRFSDTFLRRSAPGGAIGPVARGLGAPIAPARRRPQRALGDLFEGRYHDIQLPLAIRLIMAFQRENPAAIGSRRLYPASSSRPFRDCGPHVRNNVRTAAFSGLCWPIAFQRSALQIGPDRHSPTQHPLQILLIF